MRVSPGPYDRGEKKGATSGARSVWVFLGGGERRRNMCTCFGQPL